jgi:hypothetical protein
MNLFSKEGNKLATYNLRLFIRWAKILLNKSYYHQQQSLGRAFIKDKVHGYFNDLTGKTNWNGMLDTEGIPYNILANGKKIYFPTTIIQMALGYYDRWIIEKDPYDYKQFIKLTDWIVAKQDENGGWDVWTETGLKYDSVYSAMTQGEAISLLSRAWLNTGNDEYRESAFQAFKVMIKPVEEGGTTIYEGDDVYLEECPLIERNTILNGWIFALFGLYDFSIAFKSSQALDLLNQSLNTLSKSLLLFDANYWSYYDLRKNIASPFYHALHIEQLKALSIINPLGPWEGYCKKWIAYQNNPRNKFRAIVKKGYQKILDPGEAVIIK